MSDRLHKQVVLELEQLHHLVDTHRPLLTKCADATPDPIELSALAAMLHSFYTGTENIFKRVAVAVDGGPPRGEAWHRELLDRMASATATRAAVISPDLRGTLRGYLDFRHVFRHAYTFHLQWPKMSALVLGCEEALRRLDRELGAFLRHHNAQA